MYPKSQPNPKDKRKSSRSSSQNRSRKKSRSRSKSRSISKKKSYKSPNKFYFNQKSVFLTYPHVEKYGIAKDELGEYLFDTFKCKVTVICLEHHQDGSPHLHAWLEWEENFYTKNNRIFDYKNTHPNIGCMKDKTKNTRANALKYMMKEDKELAYFYLKILI